MTICAPNKGNSLLFWQDNWHNTPLKILFPQLYSFVVKPKGSVTHFLDSHFERLFSLRLSSQASDQLEALQDIIQCKNWNLDLEDEWMYVWQTNLFSSKKPTQLQGTIEASLFPWLQYFVLAFAQGQTKYQKSTKEKKQRARRLHLCALQQWQ